METIDLKIEGMTCGGCVKSVMRVLSGVAGVSAADVSLEEGRARPLVEILAQVKDRLGGEVVGVEFERKGDRYVYEFKVVTSGGRLREVYVDALTAEILKSKDE